MTFGVTYTLTKVIFVIEMARPTCFPSYFFADQKGPIPLKGIIMVGLWTDSAVYRCHQTHTGARQDAKRANRANSNEAAHGAVFTLLHAPNQENTRKARSSPHILARSTLGECLLNFSHVVSLYLLETVYLHVICSILTSHSPSRQICIKISSWISTGSWHFFNFCHYISGHTF